MLGTAMLPYTPCCFRPVRKTNAALDPQDTVAVLFNEVIKSRAGARRSPTRPQVAHSAQSLLSDRVPLADVDPRG
jgi:hypothetical protein